MKTTVRWLCCTVLISLASPAAEAQAAPSSAAQDTTATRLARAQEMLDAGSPELALGLIEPILKRDGTSAPALLIRSTAHIMMGNVDAGRNDLDRLLGIDPNQRQAWLNRAALHLNDQQNEAALNAFEQARRLDPAALDNELNIGAVELLLGKLEAATASFESYIRRSSASAEAFYLVATNFALNSYGSLASRNLEQAIGRQERFRLRARTDPNFAALNDDPEFQQILLTDSYRPPAGSSVVEQTYDQPYQAGDGQFLSAMLDVLHFHAIPFESNVEVTPNWALIWGPIRIKLAAAGESKGTVTLSAAPGQIEPQRWQQLTPKILKSFAKKINGLPLIPGVD